MSKEVEEAMERLERAQNDICYATLYSQEEQDKDIETVLNYIKELEKERDGIYEDYQDLGKEYSKLEDRNRELEIEKTNLKIAELEYKLADSKADLTSVYLKRSI